MLKLQQRLFRHKLNYELQSDRYMEMLCVLCKVVSPIPKSLQMPLGTQSRNSIIHPNFGFSAVRGQCEGRKGF